MENENTNLSTYGDPLAPWLDARLGDWELARKPQEEKMLECYQDVMRIARDGDTSGTGTAKSRKAKALFIGSTRNKVRAARAKINDALFGDGKMPFDVKPTNDELKPFTDTLEAIIVDQLERGKFKDLIKTGVNTLATYGTGFLFGPFVKTEELIDVIVDNTYGVPELTEQKFEFDLPYFELGNTLDVIPDPDAKDEHDGSGIFWMSHLSPHTVSAWAKDKSYQNVEDALKCVESKRDGSGSDLAADMRANVTTWTKGGRIKVARFFGRVPRSYLSAGAENAEGVSPLDYVEAVVVMAGGVVVKKAESPYNKRPSLRCMYESVEHEMWGVGVAENNMPHQKTVNAAFRLFMEGKGMALLGTKAVDRSKFLPTEDFKKYPGKVYQFKPGLSADEKKAAIIEFTEADITDGWLDVINMSAQFSDDDTAITKYTQGNDANHLNKTATGISMIMGASSLPTKEVLQNIDQMWIEPAIEGIINWDLKYLDVATVERIHGEERAAIWAQIKRFGKTSFMEWKATGAQTFVQKEILVQKLQQFMAIAMGNPTFAQLVDARRLLEDVWTAMQTGTVSPIKKEDGELSPEAQQLQQQLQQCNSMLQELGEKYNELHDSRDTEMQKLTIERFKAETDRIKIIIDKLGPDQLAQLAANLGLQLMTSTDIDPGEETASMEASEAQQEPPPMEMMEQHEEPAEAGFFTPEAPEQTEMPAHERQEGGMSGGEMPMNDMGGTNG